MGLFQAGQQLQRGGLARAVAAQQGQKLPTAQRSGPGPLITSGLLRLIAEPELPAPSAPAGAGDTVVLRGQRDQRTAPPHSSASQSRPSRTVTGQGALAFPPRPRRAWRRAWPETSGGPGSLSRRAHLVGRAGAAAAAPGPSPPPRWPGERPPPAGAPSAARSVPSSRLILPSTARKSEAAMGSSWLVGSSRISTSGCMAMTEARFSSCFCPPDRSATSR